MERPQVFCLQNSLVHWRCCAVIQTIALLAGCNTMEGPASLQLNSSSYNRAFDACIEVGRGQGMPPVIADRGNGIIETEPRSIGSAVEPWRLDTTGPSQTMESTLQFQRRRVRFTFVPVDFQPQVIDGTSDFAGAADPGSPVDTARFDLETYSGTIELRTRVFVERGFTPGIRQNTWSSSLTTRSTEPAPPRKSDGTTRSPTAWTPIGRDEAAERTLTAQVQKLLGATAPASPVGEPSVTERQTDALPSS